MIVKLSFVLTSSICLIACQNPYSSKPNQPTEAALVANSIANGLSAELNIDYKQAFQNLKQAYTHCVAFTRDDDLIFTDNKLDTQLEMGALFGRSEGGVYVYKTTIEALSPEKTRLTLYLPPGYVFAKSRLKQDVQRALGDDPECNRNHTVLN